MFFIVGSDDPGAEAPGLRTHVPPRLPVKSELNGPVEPVAEVAEARQDVFLVVELAVEGGGVDVHVGVRGFEGGHAFGGGDDAEEADTGSPGLLEHVDRHDGAATGGGLSIAIASDIRIGTEHARFACSYLNLGLGGADVGSSYFLPKIAGSAHAADMLYSGRIVDATEAKEMGLITKIVARDDLLSAAFAIADGIVRKASPLGLRLTKQVLNETVTGISLDSALKLENRNQILASQTEDAREARQAWAEKREPTWKDA